MRNFSAIWALEQIAFSLGNRSFDSANTTTPASCTSAVCNPTNRISSSGYSFDADGNLTQDAEGYRFGYDSESRQKEYFDKNNSGSTPDATYYYDGEGRRVKKISSTETTVFVYDGIGRMIAEYSTDLAETQQVSYLTTDHLGSPRLITNEIGAVKKRQDFAAFGDETLTAARVGDLGYTTADELRQDYTGYQKDTESGLEYAQARYYNTAHGRFTSVDPLTASATIRNPQSFNRYSYVLNSPYKFTDPLGLAPGTSGSFCAQWCNGTGPMATGTFFGIDTSMGANMMFDLDVARAVEFITKGGLDNRFVGSVSDAQKESFKKELQRILNGGDRLAKSTVLALLAGQIKFSVHPQNKSTGVADASGHTYLQNVDQVNKDLHTTCGSSSAGASSSCSKFSATHFQQYFVISVREDLVFKSPDMIGNILHEAVHAFSGARVLSEWGSGNKNYDENTYGIEYFAKEFSTARLKAFGGPYVTFLQQPDPGFLDANGNFVIAKFQSAATAEAASYGTTGVWLRNSGVVFP